MPWLNRKTPEETFRAAPERSPIRLLTDDEFHRLSKEDKIAYLSKAIEALRKGRPVIGIIPSLYPQGKQPGEDH